MSTSDSQVLTLTANTEAHAGWPVYGEWIVITNETTDPVYVATDGTAATVGGNGLDVVLPGQQAMFSNRQPRILPMVELDGVTVQQLINPASGYLTYVSVIGAAAGTVVVSAQ